LRDEALSHWVNEYKGGGNKPQEAKFENAIVRDLPTPDQWKTTLTHIRIQPSDLSQLEEVGPGCESVE
jgi:hypothetical protein